MGLCAGLPAFAKASIADRQPQFLSGLLRVLLFIADGSVVDRNYTQTQIASPHRIPCTSGAPASMILEVSSA